MGESRNENILENILGAQNELETPVSRNEEILQAILNGTSYDKPAQSRIEDLLIQILETGGGGSSQELLNALIDGTIESVESNATLIKNYKFWQCSNLKSATFPEVTAIKPNAFQGCSNLESVSFPKLVTIDSQAFAGCSKLVSVEFPMASKLPSYCFQNCSNLETIKLGKCTIIADNVFSGASKLKTVVLKSNTMCSLWYSNAFTGTPFGSEGSGGTLYVPDALISNYQSNTNWSALLAMNANNKILKIEGSEFE